MAQTTHQNDFIFILNGFNVDPTLKLPYMIADEHYLQRATESQVKAIKKQIGSRSLNFPKHISLYERIITPKPTKSKNGYTYQYSPALDPSSWNYFVIENKKDWSSREFDNISKSFLLNGNFIADGKFIYLKSRRKTPTFICNSDVLNTYYKTDSTDRIFNYNSKITHSLLLEIKDTYLDLQKIEEDRRQEAVNVYSAIRRYGHPLKFPDTTAFQWVEIISILEYLLTLDPYSTRGAGAINYQLSNKINLINNRLKSPIIIDNYFDGDIKFNKVITKLYSLRNKIAHGMKFSFNDDEFKSLKNFENVVKFTNDLITNILKFSLKEPLLINDLKFC